MNAWWLGCLVLLASFAACGVAALRGNLSTRLVSMQMAGTLTTAMLLVLAQALRRPSLFDLALVMALLTLPAALVFVRYLGNDL